MRIKSPCPSSQEDRDLSHPANRALSSCSMATNFTPMPCFGTTPLDGGTSANFPRWHIQQQLNEGSGCRGIGGADVKPAQPKVIHCGNHSFVETVPRDNRPLRSRKARINATFATLGWHWRSATNCGDPITDGVTAALPSANFGTLQHDSIEHSTLTPPPQTLILACGTVLQSAADSTGVAGAILKGFLADAAAVLRIVPSPKPSRSPIFAQDSPCERRAAIRAESTATRGRPRDFPLVRAFRKPARTRSTINDRSAQRWHPGQ